MEEEEDPNKNIVDNISQFLSVFKEIEGNELQDEIPAGVKKRLSQLRNLTAKFSEISEEIADEAPEKEGPLPKETEAFINQLEELKIDALTNQNVIERAIEVWDKEQQRAGEGRKASKKEIAKRKRKFGRGDGRDGWMKM